MAAKKPPFPVYIAMKGMKLPETGTYFVVSKDRLYIHKDTGIVRALVEVDKISFLADVEPEVQLRLPKLPPDVICRSKMFFAGVFKKYRSESALILHYSTELQQYYLHCPEQQVSYGGVNYTLEDRFEGYQPVGTIHSHCDFNAFHSGTDIGDEEYQDGLHITLGHVNSENFSASGSLVVNGTRFQVELENSALGVRPITHGNAIRDRLVSLEHQNRYRVSLTEEEIKQVKDTWGAEIVGWINDQVSKQGGFGGWGGSDKTAAATGWTHSPGKGWTKQAEAEVPDVEENDADWDAEAVLRDNELWPDSGDDMARDFTEFDDPDLADLTVQDSAALDKAADKLLKDAENKETENKETSENEVPENEVSEVPKNEDSVTETESDSEGSQGEGK